MAEVNNTRSTPRDPHWDVLKGLTMVLVIISHMFIVDQIGYSFLGFSITIVIPIFFFTSGYFLSPKQIQGHFGSFLWKKFKSIWMPYTLFFVLSIVFTEMVIAPLEGYPLFSFEIDWTQSFYAYFFAGKNLFDFALVPAPIWFLHALFFASIVSYWVLKPNKAVFTFIVMVILMTITYPLQSFLGDDFSYWIVKLLPAAIAFMLLGNLFRKAVDRTRSAKESPNADKEKSTFGMKVFAGVGSILLMVISASLYLYGGGDVWNISTDGYFLAALAGVFGCFLFSRITDNYILQYIGKNSLLFLGIHPLVISVPVISTLPMYFSAQGLDGALSFLLAFSVDIVITLFIVVLVDRTVIYAWRALKSTMSSRGKRGKTEQIVEKDMSEESMAETDFFEDSRDVTVPEATPKEAQNTESASTTTN